MPAADFHIELKSGTASEERTRHQLRALLDRCVVARWVGTRSIVIEDRAIPHSHPVLTIDTRDLGDEYVIATFLHEQVHWLLTDRYSGVRKAKDELRRYPDIHRPLPVGATNEDSTYLHLIVNCLERRALLEVMGADALDRMTPFWLTDHYTAIYEIILRDHEQIDALIDAYGLAP